MRQAAAQGAGVVQVQELFATPDFCIEQRPEYFALAAPMQGRVLATCDLDAVATLRGSWGLFSAGGPSFAACCRGWTGRGEAGTAGRSEAGAKL